MIYHFNWKEIDHSQSRYFKASNMLEAIELFTQKYYSHLSKLTKIKLISDLDEIENIISRGYLEN
jgi:hypothetical protein